MTDSPQPPRSLDPANPAPGRSARRRAQAVPPWAVWLIGPVLLGSGLLALTILRAQPFILFSVVALAALAAVILWIVTSVLWPARADRGCPRCGVDALVRSDPDTTVGIRCTACGFSDDSQSSWLLAEEEGPLEEVVLSQRGRKRRTRPPSPSREVDSTTGAGYDSPSGKNVG